MAFKTLDQAGDLTGKRALVRVDFNVPMADGKVSDDTRLRAALPTIRALSAKGAKVVLLAHFDRPKGKRVAEMSLEPVVGPLSELLQRPVAFADDWWRRLKTAASACLKTFAFTAAKRRTTLCSPISWPSSATSM
jgi:phosphoglycerate kinase